MTDGIEFTMEDIKKLNFFEPQNALECLNDLLRDKVNLIAARIECEMIRKHCDHDLSYYTEKDIVVCKDCGKEWKQNQKL